MNKLTHQREQLANFSFQQCSNLPKPEVIVEKIIQDEKENEEKEIAELANSRFSLKKLDDSYWQKQKESYLNIEEYIRENLHESPSWDVAGPLHYGMTLEEMKNAILRKFQQMSSSGSLLTEVSFSKNFKHENFFRLRGRGSKDLTRIWGSEFLRANLGKKNTDLNAAEHFLILDQSTNEIEVEVVPCDGYPCLSGVKNAYILSRKIEGLAKAHLYRSSPELDELGYRDFSDSGNIIRDSNDIGWVVDTELKSFDLPKLSFKARSIREYLPKRFKVLASQDYRSRQVFKFSIADLQLKD